MLFYQNYTDFMVYHKMFIFRVWLKMSFYATVKVNSIEKTFDHPMCLYWFAWLHSQIPIFASRQLTVYLIHRLTMDIFIDTSCLDCVLFVWFCLNPSSMISWFYNFSFKVKHMSLNRDLENKKRTTTTLLKTDITRMVMVGRFLLLTTSPITIPTCKAQLNYITHFL